VFLGLGSARSSSESRRSCSSFATPIADGMRQTPTTTAVNGMTRIASVVGQTIGDLNFPHDVSA
jgi:hypothetical protein